MRSMLSDPLALTKNHTCTHAYVYTKTYTQRHDAHTYMYFFTIAGPCTSSRFQFGGSRSPSGSRPLMCLSRKSRRSWRQRRPLATRATLSRLCSSLCHRSRWLKRFMWSRSVPQSPEHRARPRSGEVGVFQYRSSQSASSTWQSRKKWSGSQRTSWMHCDKIRHG